MKTKGRTIIYVNFSPYENTGKILDYIKSKFENILLFSFNFHKLGKNQKPSALTLLKNGKVKKSYILHTIPTPLTLIFILLPLRSIIILIQILFYVTILKSKYEIYDTYFTVNAFTAWIGFVLKKIGIVKRTIFWVWDYYPPHNKDYIVRFIRWAYWQFDRISTQQADKVVFLNQRLVELRKSIGVLPLSSQPTIVPIGIKPSKPIHKKNNHTLGFLGVLKKTQGLGIIIEASDDLTKMYPNLHLEIIGSGPDENYFKERAKKSSLQTKFYGNIREQADAIENIVGSWAIGLAPYIPGEGNVSYYGDPSKIKLYYGQNLPVVSTNVYFFSKEIDAMHAGIIVPYDKVNILKAIKNIFDNYVHFQNNVHKLAEKYDYKKIYKRLFE